MENELELIRAGRRSRIKTRTWAALFVMGIATPAELAEAANTTVARIHAVMHGDGQRFSQTTGLISLGVARPVPIRGGTAYEITPGGRTAWTRLRPRFGYTEAQLTARWPSPDTHLTVR